MLTSREKDALELLAFLEQCGPRTGTTLGQLADRLGRSVRYVHGLVRDDDRFHLDTAARRVGSFWVALPERIEARRAERRARH